MPDLLEISIVPSSDTVHLGDSIILYFKIRNTTGKKILLDSLSYNLPNGFIIKEAFNDVEYKYDTSFWSGLLNFFWPSRGRETALGVKREVSFLHLYTRGKDAPDQDEIPKVIDNKTMCAPVNLDVNDTRTIALPLRIGGHLPFYMNAGIYNFVFEVKYRTCDKLPEQDGTIKPDSKEVLSIPHYQPTRYSLTIFYHTIYVLAGGAVGGLIGGFLRVYDSLQTSTPQFRDMLPIPIGAILGFVFVLMFNRKSGVQSFITIEDFLGGLVVGIVAGYGGIEILKPFLTAAPGSANTINQTVVNQTVSQVVSNTTS